MSRRLVALLGAGLMSLCLATGAVAKVPPGTVTVDATGCTFMVHVAWAQPQAVTTWKVKVYNAANWKDGETLIKDQALDDADGKIDGGPYTLPEGHYKVAVDNEESVDGSSMVIDFTLSCPAKTATPTATPTGEELGETGTPTPTPTGEELGETGTGGGVGFVGGVSMTPPPTDAGAVATSDGNSGLPLIAISILGIASTLAWFTRRTLATARASRRR